MPPTPFGAFTSTVCGLPALVERRVSRVKQALEVTARGINPYLTAVNALFGR